MQRADNHDTAIMKALIASNGGLDMQTVAAEHVNAQIESVFGWGTGTRLAVQRLRDGTHNYHNSGNSDATGNGVIMKIAPVAYFCSQTKVESESVKEKFIEEFARMTHNNNLSVVCALFHFQMLEKVFNRAHADDLEENHVLIGYLKSGAELSRTLESRYLSQEERLHFKEIGNLLSDRISKLHEVALAASDSLQRPILSDDDLIDISHGGTFFVVNSLTMVWGLLCSQPLSFDSVLRAALIGGDADSNAAMVGSVLGGLKGMKVFPEKYVSGLHKINDLIATGKVFSKLVQSLLSESTE